MDQISVELEDRSYSIIIDRGSVTKDSLCKKEFAYSLFNKVDASVVVTDENVSDLYGRDFMQGMISSGVNATPVVIAPGEGSKNLLVFGSLMDLFVAAGLSRKSLVVALGGGVVGDLAGFAAASWMRGIGYLQIPTTLLAMVDSSVGGKTAVDIPAGKNLVGAFHQPSLVIIDPDFLLTLPEREYKSGMAEVIKYGAISSGELFAELESVAEQSTGQQASALDGVIASCIRIKAEIVAEDEFDNGRRQILNFGHTFGHAIEVHYGFSKHTHGEAVAIGMRIAAKYGEDIGLTEPGTSQRLCALLDKFGLDAEIDPSVYPELIRYIRNDKKTHGDSANLVLLKSVGEAVVVPVALTELESRLEKLSK